LNAILGYARLLRSGMLPPERQVRAVETVERNATSLTQIVEDVLDVSRIVSGKIRLDIKSIDLSRVVADSIESLMPAAEAKQVRLTTIIDPRAEPISGDADRIQQIVWNLVSNAVKFTPKGGVIQVKLERVDSHVAVTVSDTGIGIGPEFLPYVFDRFRQADGSTTRRYGGLGLGLAIARHLVELHGGTIQAASEGDGHGSTFTVMLPVMAVQAGPRPDDRHAPPAADDRRAREARLDGVTVFAVDDDHDALALVREILEAAGARVTAIDSAVKALEQIEQGRPDVVIADIGLPGMDGLELIARIRRLPDRRLRQVPAAALTAYARSQDRVRSLQSGYQIHLSKPVDPAELIAAIAALARRVDDEPEVR